MASLTTERMACIAVGAEATLHTDTAVVIKTRLEKKYRHPALDAPLRKLRTRREARILSELEKISFPSPRLVGADEKAMTVTMSFLSGKKLRDVLESNALAFSRDIGFKIAMLHQHGIVHGDLTTSNMIVADGSSSVHLIDFGLGQFSTRAEDQAVDLHLLQRALDSKHSAVAKKCFAAVLDAYQEGYPDAPVVLERLRVVERRGRHRAKKGS